MGPGKLAAVAAAAIVCLPTAGHAEDVSLDSPVELHFTVVERGPEHPWEFRIENSSSEPVDVVVDPRLLWFEATVPGKKKPVTCKLPKSMFPKTAHPDAVVTLRPGRDAIRTFDPRLFCFSNDDQDVLVPGTQLTPNFGWPSKTKTRWKRGRKVSEKLPDSAPFVAMPAQKDTSSTPIKNVTAEPMSLDAPYAVWAPPEDDDETEKTEPELILVRGSDASTERTVSATWALKNPTKNTLKIFVRRELVTFEVLGPDGLAECNAQPDDREPSSSAFVTLRPGRSTRLVSRVVELCPRGTFSRPGFYLLNGTFESQIDGADWGVTGWTGAVRAKRPVAVRVQTGSQPFLFGPPEKKEQKDKKGGKKKSERKVKETPKPKP